jgi:hypothetical protein
MSPRQIIDDLLSRTATSGSATSGSSEKASLALAGAVHTKTGQRSR